MFGTTKRDFGYFECTISKNVFWSDRRRTDRYSYYHWKCCCCYLSSSCGYDQHPYKEKNRRYFNLIWFSNVNCIYYPNGLWWPINIWMRSSLTLGFFYKALWEKQLSWQKYYNLYVKFSNFLSMPSWQIAVLVFCLSGPKLVALWTEHETPCKFFKLFIL